MDHLKVAKHQISTKGQTELSQNHNKQTRYGRQFMSANRPFSKEKNDNISQVKQNNPLDGILLYKGKSY